MTDSQNISPLDQARILSEALPHMQQYDEETIVIKYGGHAMGAEDLAKAFARDIVLLEQTAINPVVVHGGGPQIATMLKRLGIVSDRKSTRLNSSHVEISYAVFCLKKKNKDM